MFSSDPPDRPLINRREAIRRVSVMLGAAAFAGGNRLLSAVESDGQAVVASSGIFNAQDIALLDEIAETILPQTGTPGAKAAHVGEFMARMVSDCYSAAEQAIFRGGLHALDAATQKASDVPFMRATTAQRTAVLKVLDQEQKRLTDAREAAERRKKGLAPIRASEAVSKSQADPNLPHEQIENLPTDSVNDTGDSHKEPAHYFRMMKELALLGYFTSEIGCTQALRYAETPGRYDPCLPYTPGERAWAAHA